VTATGEAFAGGLTLKWRSWSSPDRPLRSLLRHLVRGAGGGHRSFLRPRFARRQMLRANAWMAAPQSPTRSA